LRVSNQNNKWLGSQTLPPQTVAVGQTLFSAQSVFGGTYTAYAVYTDISTSTLAVLGTDYNVTNGTLEFLTAGVYDVQMTNTAIVSSTSYPAVVNVKITAVVPPPSPPSITTSFVGRHGWNGIQRNAFRHRHRRNHMDFDIGRVAGRIVAFVFGRNFGNANGGRYVYVCRSRRQHGGKLHAHAYDYG
jgi:hypothetical protein